MTVSVHKLLMRDDRGGDPCTGCGANSLPSPKANTFSCLTVSRAIST